MTDTDTWHVQIPIGGTMNESDHPFEEVVATAEGVIAKGGRVFQKYTCSGCGQRLAMDKPNVFYKTGECDKCGAVTDIEANGCNYLAVFDRSHE